MEKDKYILAAGDSFTCSYLDPSPVCPEVNSDFTRWPELLGQKLDLNVKNLGKSGTDNTYIYNKLVTDLLENHDQIELVVVGWSSPDRFQIWSKKFTPLNDMFHQRQAGDCTWDFEANEMRVITDSFYYQFFDSYLWNWGGEYSSPDNIITTMILETFSHMLNIQRLCKLLNKPLIMSAMLRNLDPYQIHLQMRDSNNPPALLHKFDPLKSLEFITHSEVFLGIDSKSCIGYPFIESIGGFNIQDLIMKKDMRMCDNDPHPNEEGHKLLADMYYEHYQKNFT